MVMVTVDSDGDAAEAQNEARWSQVSWQRAWGALGPWRAGDLPALLGLGEASEAEVSRRCHDACSLLIHRTNAHLRINPLD